MNGTNVSFEAHEIPLSLRIGICQIPAGGLSYQKALDILAESVEETRKGKGYVVVYTGSGA
jgi:hypothetical protein